MMRHSFLLLAGSVLLAAIMVSCQTESEFSDVDITSVRCSIDQIDVEEDFASGILDSLPATKVTINSTSFLWSTGDRIGIVPNKGAQIYFAVKEGGSTTASFDGGDWAMKSSGTFYAYYPLYPDIFLSKDHVSVSYSGQIQTGNNNNLHAGDFWTLYTDGTTAVGNTLSFDFHHLTSFFKTYVTVPAGTYTKIVFSAPSEVFIKDGYFDLGAQTPAIVGTTFTDELTLDLQNVTFTEGTELTGFLVVAPVDITGIPITVTVYKDEEAAYEYSLTKTSAMVAAKTYAFRATALTQVVATVAQANALFASGETSVTISEPLTEDATVVLPNTAEAVTLTLPTTASTSTLTVSYTQNADSYPATLSITGPEGTNLDIYTPNTTVTVNGISYNQITSRTAANTCIISEGVTVNLLKVILGGVQVYGTVSQIDLSEQEDESIIYVSGSVDMLLGEDDEEYTAATGISLDQSSLNLTVGSTGALTATVAPAGSYPEVIWTSSDETVATVSSSGVVSAIAAGTSTITVTSISGGFTAVCNVSATDPLPDYVDLGLSVKWATRNLCETGLVSSPEDYGDYFAWGEVVPKDSYRWSTYEFASCNQNDAFSSLLKYNTQSSLGTVDNLTTLERNDDAAYVILGSQWRMPTLDEAKELINCCDFVNTTLNGVDGYLVTSRINGNSIFLPTAQYWDSNGIVDYGYGRYWLSSLYTGYNLNSKYACRISLRPPSYENYRDWDWFERFAGLSIRPVYDDTIHPESVSLNKASMTLYVGGSEQLIATVSPSNATDKTVTWSVYNASVASVDNEGNVTADAVGSATIKVTTVDGALTATCIVNVIPVPEVVDLGLSVYWASSNLGASTPEQYGDYFAWGEIETKDSFTAGNYSYSEIPTILPQSHDAAYSVLGELWRMPTVDEWNELLNTNNCTWEWVTVNGIDGYRVTSKVPGHTENSIFLPAGGYYNDSALYRNGQRGYYWSSNSYSGYAPWYNLILRDTSDLGMEYNEVAYRGFSIRPVSDDRIHPLSVELNRSSLLLSVGDSEQLTAIVTPTNATKTVVWSSNNNSVATVDSDGIVIAVSAGYVTITVTTVDGGFQATCSVEVVEPINGHKYVDLGLPSGLKWATCNIGATVPEECGDFFAWGEPEPYYSSKDPLTWKNGKEEGYWWTSYIWCNGSYNTQTKYCSNSSYGTVDDKTVLDMEDDAAHVNWGGTWRVPTVEEWRELRTCRRKKTTRNGVFGILFTGPNGNTLFLPATGYGAGDQLFCFGSSGHYWSSSLYTGDPRYAWSLFFDDEDFDIDQDDMRYLGLSIRPVSD